MPIRILIVDDSAAIRQAARSCIESNTKLEICGEAENGVVALDMLRKVNPDVLVLDLAMPGMNELAAAQEIKASAPGARVVVFTRTI